MPTDDLNTRRTPSDASVFNAIGQCVNGVKGAWVAHRLELETSALGEADAVWSAIDGSGNMVLNVPSGRSIRSYVNGVDTGALGGGGGGVDLATATGVLALNKGGTGATDAAGARTAIGAAASAHTHSAADISSGTIATSRLGSGTANSTTFLRGDNTWATPAGGSGNLDGLSDVAISSVSPGQTLRYDGTNFVNYTLAASDVGAAAASHTHSLGDLTAGTISTSTPLTFSSSATTGTNNASPELYVAPSSLAENLPPGWQKLIRINGANWYSLSANGFTMFGDGTISATNCCLIRTTTSFTMNGIAGRANRINAGTSTNVSTGAAWTGFQVLTGLTDALFYVFVPGHGYIEMYWDGATLTKIAGAATLVVPGPAGATEVAFRVSGGHLQASNGTGSNVSVFMPGCWSR